MYRKTIIAKMCMTIEYINDLEDSATIGATKNHIIQLL